jgi:2'-5' RNA ligase
MTEGKAIRTFLALEAPEGVRGEMARIQERLRRGVSGSIRWVEATGMHLTLKFFGDVDPGDIPGIAAPSVNKRGEAPIRLVTVWGLSPTPVAPGWSGWTTGETSVQSGFSRDWTVFAKWVFPPEDRPFRENWTLGRINPPGLTGFRGPPQGAVRAWTNSADSWQNAKRPDAPGGRLYELTLGLSG